MDDKERGEQVLIGKDVAFYETFLSAWVENRMELDKQLLTLSSLAIGLVMVFYDKSNTTIEFILWFLACLLFICTIIIVLNIFYKNSQYIGQLIRNEDQTKTSSLEIKLQRLTYIASCSFIIGIVFTFALAISKSGFSICNISGG